MAGGKHILGKGNARRVFGTAKVGDRGQIVIPKEAREMLGIEPEIMFKTLVTVTDKLEHRVFLIPVAEELDLKKCAVKSGDKRVELIPVKELLPLTGYIRGGCSPIGMKKKFPTFIDETAILFDKIYISAGMRGVQIIINPEDLRAFTNATYADLVK